MEISVRRHLESETITLPEAAALVGKDVRITIVEETGVDRGGPPGAASTLADLAARIQRGEIEYDFDALEDGRRRSMT